MDQVHPNRNMRIEHRNIRLLCLNVYYTHFEVFYCITWRVIFAFTYNYNNYNDLALLFDERELDISGPEQTKQGMPQNIFDSPSNGL